VLTGKVVNWKSDRGFGFIVPDDGGPDVFLHVAELDGVPTNAIHSGVHVEFQSVKGPKGPKAVGVKLTDKTVKAKTLVLPQEDGQADYLTTEEFGREVTAVLDRASVELQTLAKRHGWVE
jgi:CspA family cold shock protein